MLPEQVGTRRAENLRRVEALRSEGLNGIQIADATGLSRSYVYGLMKDPTGQRDRDRKRQYDGVCVDCGGRTVGDGRRSGPPVRCKGCAEEHARRSVKWTREACLDAIRRWADLYGLPPTATDWNVSHASHHGERRERFEAGDWPHLSVVQERCGGWNAAIVAAGYEPHRVMKPRLTEAAIAGLCDLAKAGYSLVEIAQRVGITPEGVRYHLVRRGQYEPTPRRGTTVSAPLKAEQIIDREIERAEARITKLEEEIADHRDTVSRLKNAREALNTPALRAA